MLIKAAFLLFKIQKNIKEIVHLQLLTVPIDFHMVNIYIYKLIKLVPFRLALYSFTACFLLKKKKLTLAFLIFLC